MKSRWRPWFGVVCGVLLPVVAGCGLLDPDDHPATEELARARARWAAAGIDDYRLQVHRMCFCIHASLGPATVVVENGAKVRVEFGGEAPVGVDLSGDYPTVEGLFDVVADAIARDAHSLSVLYHSTLGYPTEITIDYVENMADEELAFRAVLER